MIIVSQSKESIYNFDNVKSIDVMGNEVYITDNILANTGTLIGRYETEERAKRILQEIIKVYKYDEGKRYTIGDSQALFGKYSYGVYEMPEE